MPKLHLKRPTTNRFALYNIWPNTSWVLMELASPQGYRYGMQGMRHSCGKTGPAGTIKKPVIRSLVGIVPEDLEAERLT